MPAEREPERVYKVALFGVTGAGKSSVINLLLDKPVAKASTDAEGCTKRAQWYPISLGDKKFRLWDTMGFNPAEAQDIDPLSPYEQAHTLLRNLHEGVDLILLCSRKDGINASLRSLYWLLAEFFFTSRPPIALVLTHCDVPHAEWFDRNRTDIAQRCRIETGSFPPHACVTTIRNGPDSIYDQSRKALQAILQDHATTQKPTSLYLDLSSDDKCDAATQRLCNNCSLTSSDAAILVTRFKSPKRPLKAVLFGEVGAGKSSIINLLLGCQRAGVSGTLLSCTLSSECYNVNTGLHQFSVWDTVGLNGTAIGHDACKEAMENGARLIRELYREGGVDLLVFCKKNGRLSNSELCNFRLFHEFLCEGQVPVAFIITHLEHEDPMEKWWEINGKDLLTLCNLPAERAPGHACITSLPPDHSTDPKFQDKLRRSRQSAQTILEDSTLSGGSFKKDEGTWVMSFLRKLVGMVRVGNPRKRDKVTVKTLQERCELQQDQAAELIRLLYG